MKDLVKSGWQTMQLGEVCSLLNGRAYKKPELLESGRYPVLRVGNFFTNNHWYYSDLELDENKYCDNGDLLYAWSASFGPRIWNGGKVIYHYHIWKVVPSEQVLRDYLFYFFDWDKERIKDEQGAGATMIHVSKRSMEARAIPVPPLEEQRRIVAVLDEAFAGLARARENAEVNLQNARELLAEMISRRFSAIAATDGSVKALGEMADFRNGLNFKRTSSGAEVKVVGVGDFKDNFEVPLNELSSVTVDGDLSEADCLQAGDLLAVRSNGNRELIGRTMVLPELEEPVSFSGFTIRIRLKTEELSPAYLCEFMKTREARAKLTAGGGGANISNLNQTLLAGFSVHYPDRPEQRRVLDELGALRIYAQRLVDRCRDQLDDLDDLRQSLLQNAFAGELT